MRRGHVRLLYLSYWDVDDGLTHATVYPHLEVLAASARLELILFVSVERGAVGRFDPELARRGVRHAPLQASSFGPDLLCRALDFVKFPAALARLCRENGITRILARGANAGSLAHLTQRHVSIPYAVESFEPHATYMLESKVWARWDPRYIFQKRWEDAQKREATELLPVTDAYRAALIADGVADERVVMLPCTVDTDRFRFDAGARQQVRDELRAPPQAIVGIYVGKFGGIYYDKEAFEVFARFASDLASFRMVVLTPTDRGEVMALAKSAGFPVDRLSIASVSHHDVPRYLCAADVGFATVRMAPSRRALSLVKVGEYLACGLPIVITEGVGDDSDMVRDHDAGAVLDLTAGKVEVAVDHIRHLLAEPGHRARIAMLASQFRSRRRVTAAYEAIGLIGG
jgi:glycosyltransferase involved in cell wall biosynthesis